MLRIFEKIFFNLKNTLKGFHIFYVFFIDSLTRDLFISGHEDFKHPKLDFIRISAKSQYP